MKREIIDASQFELEETVVSIKRVTKGVKGGLTCALQLWLSLVIKTVMLVPV